MTRKSRIEPRRECFSFVKDRNEQRVQHVDVSSAIAQRREDLESAHSFESVGAARWCSPVKSMRACATGGGPPSIVTDVAEADPCEDLILTGGAGQSIDAEPRLRLSTGGARRRTDRQGRDGATVPCACPECMGVHITDPGLPASFSQKLSTLTVAHGRENLVAPASAPQIGVERFPRRKHWPHQQLSALLQLAVMGDPRRERIRRSCWCSGSPAPHKETTGPPCPVALLRSGGGSGRMLRSGRHYNMYTYRGFANE
jgi:hypothetical protein